MIVKYNSNNSGGSWWLEDKDWKALEKAGWKVLWVKDEPLYSKFGSESDRWLGALAKEAFKDFSSVGEAMKEFESITGQDVMDEGCNCCGAPHTFYWGRATGLPELENEEYGYVSGSRCSEYLFEGQKTMSLREAYEELDRKETP